MLRRSEALLDPTARPPDQPPTEGLRPFYWHFIRQQRWLVVALFIFGGLIAMLDVTIPAFIGRVVGLVSTHAPADLLRETWPQLLTMAGVLLLARPLVFLGHVVLINQIVNPGLSNMVRWQNHWHVVRQSWTFFQNDFAGRIANRVLQTGPSLRESLVMAFDAAWYIIVYGSSALALLISVDWRLTPPILLWFCGYAGILVYFVPRLRERSRVVSEMRSNLTGRVVDSYTNILTVKLFSRARDEDAFVREAVDHHTVAFRDQTRMITGYVVVLSVMNAMLIVATASLAIWQWSSGRITLGSVAMVLPLSWQITNMAGWVARSVTVDLREHRHGAGRHEVHRRGAADAGPAGRARTAGHPRRDPLRGPALRLRPGAPSGARRRAARHRPAHSTGRARRAGRPVRRRQVHAGESAAAFL